MPTTTAWKRAVLADPATRRGGAGAAALAVDAVLGKRPAEAAPERAAKSAPAAAPEREVVPELAPEQAPVRTQPHRNAAPAAGVFHELEDDELEAD